jgi:hypothetical protein
MNKHRKRDPAGENHESEDKYLIVTVTSECYSRFMTSSAGWPRLTINYGGAALVQSYVIINEGCPLAISAEGTDHVQIRCGESPGDAFEIVVQHQALRALVELGVDALQEIDAISADGQDIATA